MKSTLINWLFLILLGSIAVSALAQTQSSTPATDSHYVSDALEVPLRAGTSERYKIVGMVRGGSSVVVLKVDVTKGYTQIRTPTGIKGWLPSTQLTQTPSHQVQLAGVQQELEQLKTQHRELQNHLDKVFSRPGDQAMSYPQLYEEAQRLRQQLAEYRKVANDTVTIAEQNQGLQEQNVRLERELRIAQQESEALRNDNDTMRFLMGTLILWFCLLAAIVIPRLREQRRAQWNRL